MTEEQILFRDIFDYFAAKYPAQMLRMSGPMVERKGKTAFNTEGYNLLFNVYRLSQLISEELE